MDETTRESLKHIRESQDSFRRDFFEHCKKDDELREIVLKWSGVMNFLSWVSPATLIAVVVLIVKHWGS